MTITARLSQSGYKQLRLIILYGLFSLLLLSMITFSLREGDFWTSFGGLLLFHWFALLTLLLSIFLKAPLQQLLWADLPFTLSSLYLLFWNTVFSIQGINEGVLVYLFSMVGFIPLSLTYYLGVMIFFIIRRLTLKKDMP